MQLISGNLLVYSKKTIKIQVVSGTISQRKIDYQFNDLSTTIKAKFHLLII